jgi:hypothetical protein
MKTVTARRLLGAAALATAATYTAGAGATETAAPPKVLRPLAAPLIHLVGVASISANGDAVAIAAERSGKCGNVVLWSPTRRRMSTVGAGCYGTGGFNGITDLVLGRKVVAWVFTWGDRDSGSDCLMIHQVTAARIGRAITRKAHACNVDYYGDSYGVRGRRIPAFQSVANGGTTGAGGGSSTASRATATFGAQRGRQRWFPSM